MMKQRLVKQLPGQRNENLAAIHWRKSWVPMDVRKSGRQLFARNFRADSVLIVTCKTQNNPPAQPDGKSRAGQQRVLIGRRPRNTLLRIAVLVVVIVVMQEFILLPIRVDAVSPWNQPTTIARSTASETGWPISGINRNAAMWWPSASPIPAGLPTRARC